MIIFQRIKRILASCFIDLSLSGLILLLLGYALTNWVLLLLSGEQFVYNPINYIYWLVVTASTVGYGDYSPIHTSGKLVVSFFTIPFGLGLFGLIISNAATYLSYQFHRGIKGLRRIKMNNHIIVIGWHEHRTPKLVELLLHEEAYRPEGARNIILCTTDNIDNPFKNGIKFVKVSSYVNSEEMARASIQEASLIVVDLERDDLTLSATLVCYDMNDKAHIVANFIDANTSRIASSLCTNIECSPDLSIELLAKSAADKGSSALHKQLLNVSEGMTQYTITYPADNKSIELEKIFMHFKVKYDATLIGIKDINSNFINLNPKLNTIINPGAVIHYIADERITGINWS